MNETILVIEDNALNLELFTVLLEAHGFTVARAGTAEDGLRRALECEPALVLMDLSLPGMDGLTAAKALKSRPETCHLPVVALTAHAMVGDEELSLQAGCDGYLTKPIDTRTFAARVAAFIHLNSPNRPASDLLSPFSSTITPNAI